MSMVESYGDREAAEKDRVVLAATARQEPAERKARLSMSSPTLYLQIAGRGMRSIPVTGFKFLSPSLPKIPERPVKLVLTRTFTGTGSLTPSGEAMLERWNEELIDKEAQRAVEGA